MSVSTESAAKTYDGMPLTAGGSVSGLAQGETVTLETTGSRKNVGSCVNGYELKWDGSAKESNYSVAFEELGVLEVAPAVLTAAYVSESVAWNERPVLSLEVTGFVDGEGESTASGYSAPTVSAPGELVPGESYELLPSGGSADNYVFEYAAGTLSVGNVTFVDAPEAASGLVYDGSEQAGVEAGEGYVLSGASAKHAGEYVAMATLEDGYAWSDRTTDPKEIRWSIEPAVLTVSYKGESVAWNGRPALSLDVTGFVNGEDATTASGHVAPTVAVPERIEAGNAYELLPEGGQADNYVFEYVPGMLLVGKVPFAEADIQLSFEESVYDGSEQRPEVQVAMNGAVLEEGRGYELAYDEGCVLPGAYNVVVTGAGSFEGSVSKVFVISKRQVADAKISLSDAAFVYNGKLQRPTASVSYDGVELAEGVDFEVAYDSGCKRSGTYAVTVKGIGTCEGEATLSFGIMDAKLTASDVALSYATAAYSGAVKKPAATVKVGGVSQLKSEYAVTYWNKAKTRQVTPKNVGTYWVKVAAKAAANTTGTVWKSYKVNPKATANLKLTALNNGFKASWDKRTVQCSGYQVSYKQVGTSTWKTKTVAGYKTNFKPVTGLKDKKSYQVKVRTYKTVNGVKYYSAWTGVKTVKTK